jgi:hypothetical protein
MCHLGRAPSTSLAAPLPFSSLHAALHSHMPQAHDAPAGLVPAGASSPAKIAAARTPTTTQSSDVRSNGPTGTGNGGNQLPSRTPPVLNGHKPATAAQQRVLSQVRDPLFDHGCLPEIR